MSWAAIAVPKLLRVEFPMIVYRSEKCTTRCCSKKIINVENVSPRLPSSCMSNVAMSSVTDLLDMQSACSDHSYLSIASLKLSKNDSAQFSQELIITLFIYNCNSSAGPLSLAGACIIFSPFF